MQNAKQNLPGSIYLNNGRWWWRVRLPGEAKIKTRPLKPERAQFATKDRGVAEAIAWEIYHKAVFHSKAQLAEGGTSVIGGTIADLAGKFDVWAKGYYRKPDGTQTSEADNVHLSMVNLVDFAGGMRAEEFGPLDLKRLIEYLVKLERKVETKKGERVQKLSRSGINRRLSLIKKMFKWAVSEQLLPVSTYQALLTVEGLKRGRTEARETEPVRPVHEKDVRAIFPFTSPVVAAMLELQLLTGMRSGELVIMRPVDIDMTGDIWIYKPAWHKNAWRKLPRLIPIGKRGQQILKPFLRANVTEFCFSPEETVRFHLEKRHIGRRTPENQGNRPGSHRAENPRRTAGERYDTAGYYKAVKYAIEAANKAGVSVPAFTPHRIRHTVGTEIRKKFGLDPARAILGHTTLNMTDDYAELDLNLAVEIAKKFG